MATGNQTPTGRAGPVSCMAVLSLSISSFSSLECVLRTLLNCSVDSLPEWSKWVDSSSTSENCVVSTPTAVRLPQPSCPAILATSVASNVKLQTSSSSRLGRCFLNILRWALVGMMRKRTPHRHDQGHQQHQWSSGRIHRCHRLDPGSVPG